MAYSRIILECELYGMVQFREDNVVIYVIIT
jgi:hypothetical protein